MITNGVPLVQAGHKKVVEEEKIIHGCDRATPQTGNIKLEFQCTKLNKGKSIKPLKNELICIGFIDFVRSQHVCYRLKTKQCGPNITNQLVCSRGRVRCGGFLGTRENDGNFSSGFLLNITTEFTASVPLGWQLHIDAAGVTKQYLRYWNVNWKMSQRF